MVTLVRRLWSLSAPLSSQDSNPGHLEVRDAPDISTSFGLPELMYTNSGRRRALAGGGRVSSVSSPLARAPGSSPSGIPPERHTGRLPQWTLAPCAFLSATGQSTVFIFMRSSLAAATAVWRWRRRWNCNRPNDGKAEECRESMAGRAFCRGGAGHSSERVRGRAVAEPAPERV